MSHGDSPPAEQPRYPLHSANIELTRRCNLRCIHCGSQSGRALRDELSLDEWLQLISELAGLGCKELCLLGGEPLLFPGWRDLLASASTLGLNILIITNGYIVDAAVARELQPMLDRIGVSLDGAKAQVHDHIRGRAGSFDRAWRAILTLRDAGLEVGAITTLSRHNIDELEPLRDLLLDQDVSWQIQIASVHGGRFAQQDMITPEQHYRVGQLIASWRASYPVARLPVAGSHDIGYCSGRLSNYSETALPWAGCVAGLCAVGICSDGAVKGCLSMADDFVEGNVRSRPFAEIWNDPTCFARNRRFNVDALSGFCASCPHGAACRAGCADTAFASSGRAFENNYCFYRYEQSEAASEAQAPQASSAEEDGSSGA